MWEKADSDLVRRQNRHILIEALRQHGPMARTDLGRVTGLSPASVTAITGQLIDDDVVHELREEQAAPEPSRRGRPPTRLGINPRSTHVLAVKISVDGVELALAGFDGTIIDRHTIQISTIDAKPESFGHQVASDIKDFLASRRMTPKRLSRIEVAVQGVADSKAGNIVWSPAFRALNLPIVGPIRDLLGIPCSIANDANMIAEAVLGLDRNRYGGTVAVAFIGYGVGMGLIIDGTVYHGSTGGSAEFGHMNHRPEGPLCRCGRRGCIEAYAADYGIVRSAEGSSQTDLPPSSRILESTMRTLEARAKAGDPAAVAAYETAGEALGYGFARIIALLSPRRIVLAGPGTRALDLIAPAMHRAIERGVVDQLRRNVEIDIMPIDTDMIIKGTIDNALHRLDREVFASGPIGKHLMHAGEAG